MNIKKYELSIWQDLTNTTSYDSSALYLFNTSGIRTSVNEQKLCIIGSDTMVSNGRARNVNLTRNVNGSNNITFSVLLRYPSYNEFHPDALDKETHITKGEFVKNPIVDLLQAETKLKMWLPENKQNGEDEWLEFLIKKVEEDSTTGEIRYTATDLFINELARTGYNLAFSTEAGNNMGTAWELTEKILEDSDWVLDKDNSDRIINDKTKVFTPFYVEKFAQQYWLDKYMDLSTYKKKTINNNRIIFLLAKDEFLSSGQTIDVLGYIITQGKCVTVDGTNNHLNREQIVFQDKTYNISDFMKIIQDYYKNNELSLIATPILFPIRYSQTSKEYHYGDAIEQSLIEYDIPITLPNVLDQSPLLKYDNDKKRYYQQFCNIDVIKQLTGSSYTKVNKYINTRTFSPHFPQSIIEGIKFAQNTSTQIQTISLNSLKNMIDKLDRDYFLISYPQIGSTSQIIEKDETEGNNWYISWETKNKNQSVFQSVPITQEIYGSNSSSKWEKQNFGLSNIKYALGKLDNESLKTLQSAIRSGVTKFNMGFDIGTLDKIYDLSIQMVSSCLKEINGIYKESLVLDNIIENIQEEEKDNQGKLISKLITPMYKEMVIPQYSFYNEDGDLVTEIYEGMTNPYPYPVIDPYNQKVTQIEESDSNRFNLLQTVCENFKCWMRINVQHDKDGRLKTQNWYYKPDSQGVLGPNGYFHELSNNTFEYLKGIASLKELGAILANSFYSAAQQLGITIPTVSGKTPEEVAKSYVGALSIPIKSIQIVNSPNPTEAETAFKYGENLNSIKRTVNSEQISTYVIVEDNEIEYAEGGVCSIRDASNNPSMENAIINFDYYTSIGLLDKNEVYKDLYGNPTYDKNNLCYYWFTRTLNNKIKALVTEYNKAADELMNLKASVDIATGEVAGAYNSILKESNNLNATSNKKVSLDISKALEDIENKKIGLNKVINSITNKQPTYFNNITYKELDYLEIIYDEYNAKGNYIYYTRTGNSEKDYVYTPLTSKPSRPQSKYYSPAKNNKEIGALLDNKTVQSLLTNINKFLTQYYSSNQKATIFTDLYTTKKARVDIIESQLQTLRNEKQMHYNKFYQKYQAYIQEGLWSETIYVNPDQYYAKALDVAETSAKPQITYDIQVTDLSVLDSYQKGNNNSYKVELGQVTYVEDPYFFGNYQEPVIITEIAYNFDNPEQTKITVQNYRTRFEDLFQRLSASVQTLQYADYAYNKLSNILAPDGTILLDNLQQAIARNGLTLKNVSGQEVVQDETGITITSKYEPQKMLRIIADGIYVSRDSGNTFVNALSIDGISADVITSGVLDTQQIIISNGDKATFKWDSDGLTAFKWSIGEDNDISVDLSKFVRYDQYGIYGVDTLYYGWVAKDEADIETNARFGLTWNGFFFNAKPDWNTSDSFIKGTVRFDGLGLYGIPIEYTISDWTNQLKEKDSTIDQMKYIQDNAIFGALWNGFFIRGNSDNYTTLINGNGFLMQYKGTDEKLVNLIELGLIGGEIPTKVDQITTEPNDWKTNYYNYYKDAKCLIPITRKQLSDGDLDPDSNYVPKEVLNTIGGDYSTDQTLGEVQNNDVQQFSTILQMMVGIYPSPSGYTKESVVYPAWGSYTPVYKPSEMMRAYGVRFNDANGTPLLNYDAINGILDLKLNSLNIDFGNITDGNVTMSGYIEDRIENSSTFSDLGKEIKEWDSKLQGVQSTANDASVNASEALTKANNAVTTAGNFQASNDYLMVRMRTVGSKNKSYQSYCISGENWEQQTTGVTLSNLPSGKATRNTKSDFFVNLLDNKTNETLPNDKMIYYCISWCTNSLNYTKDYQFGFNNTDTWSARPTQIGGSLNHNWKRYYIKVSINNPAIMIQLQLKNIHIGFSSIQIEEISEKDYNDSKYVPSAWVESPWDALEARLGLIRHGDHIKLQGIAHTIKFDAAQTFDVNAQEVNINGLGTVKLSGNDIDLIANNEIRLSTGNQGKIVFNTPKFQWVEESIGMEIDTLDKKNIQLKLGNWQITQDNLQRVEEIDVYTSTGKNEVAYNEGDTQFKFNDWLFNYLQEPISDDYTFEKVKAHPTPSKKPDYLLPIYSPSAMGNNANKFYGEDGFIYWAKIQQIDGKEQKTIIDSSTYLIYLDDIIRGAVNNSNTYVLYWRETTDKTFQQASADTTLEIFQALQATNPISQSPQTFKDACRLSLKYVIDYYIDTDESNGERYLIYTHESKINTTYATHLIGKNGIKITSDNETLLKLDSSESGIISRWKIDGNLTIGGGANDNPFFPQDCDYIYFDYNNNTHISRMVKGVRSLIAKDGILISANYGESTMRLQGKVINLWADSIYIRQVDPNKTNLNYAPGNYGILYREPTGRVLLLNGQKNSDYGIAVESNKNKWNYKHGGNPGGGGIICVDTKGVPYIWSWTDAINYWK